MEYELLTLEKEFTQAIVKNDPKAIEQFVVDDWVIIDANGGIIDEERFLGVIKSGALTHEMMESDDIRVRVYGESAVITELTRTKGEFMGPGLQHSGAGYRCFCQAGWTMAMRIVAAHS